MLKNTILAGNTAPAGMPQECTGYPYFEHNPVYILSAGNNIIGDTAGCLTVPEEMPDGYAHSYGGQPLLMTLEADTSTDLLGDAGLGAFDAGGDVPGRGHVGLTSGSAAVNAGANDGSVNLDSACVGGRVSVSGSSEDQLGQGVALEVRDIGAVEYTGAGAAPATLLPMNLLAFDPLDPACALLTASDEASADAADDVLASDEISVDDDGGSLTNTAGAVAQSTGETNLSTGTGAVGPWGMLFLGASVLVASWRRQRQGHGR